MLGFTIFLRLLQLQLISTIFQVLSDLTKKNSYDEQLRKEEARRVSQKSRGISQKVELSFVCLWVKL